MVVTSESHKALARLPIPNPDHLVIRGRENPRSLSVELNSTDVVEMAKEGEHTASALVVPHLDLVVISTTHEQGLSVVEANASDRA